MQRELAIGLRSGQTDVVFEVVGGTGQYEELERLSYASLCPEVGDSPATFLWTNHETDGTPFPVLFSTEFFFI